MLPSNRTAPRGVFVLPYTGTGGEALAVAITSDGRRLAEMPMLDDADRLRVLELLRSALDREDLQRRPKGRHLRLVGLDDSIAETA